MKYFSIILAIVIIALVGCSTTQNKPGFTIKNLDSTTRVPPFKTQQTIEIRPTMDVPLITPAFFPLSDNIKFIIDSDMKLEKVAGYLKDFEGKRRLEFWTSYGIFIVSAPNYIGGRMGNAGTEIDINIEYKNGECFINITKDKHIIKKQSSNLVDCAMIIFNEIKKRKPHGSINISFLLSPNDRWNSVELIMARMFKHIDSLRGFWVGYDKNGKIRIHFHDIYKYETSCTGSVQ